MKKTSKISRTVRKGSSWCDALKYRQAMAEPGNLAVSDERDDQVWLSASRMSGRGEARGEATGEGRAILMVLGYRGMLATASCRRNGTDEVRFGEKKADSLRPSLGRVKVDDLLLIRCISFASVQSKKKIRDHDKGARRVCFCP
jgi:hypothetical protein